MTEQAKPRDAAHPLLLGDCVERMRELPEGSVASVVTDPPYGLGFMGKDWDSPGGLARPEDATTRTYALVPRPRWSVGRSSASRTPSVLCLGAQARSRLDGQIVAFKVLP